MVSAAITMALGCFCATHLPFPRQFEDKFMRAKAILNEILVLTRLYLEFKASFSSSSFRLGEWEAKIIVFTGAILPLQTINVNELY